MSKRGKMMKKDGGYARLTIKDIAQAAGVSISTVSKVMNGTGSISQRTKDRVLQLINETDYKPSALARSLHQKKTYTIGLLSSDGYGRFSLPILKGIESVLGEAQISVFLCNASGSIEEFKKHVDSLLAKRVDGIIVTAAKTDTRETLNLKSHDIPVVYAYTDTDDDSTLCVLPDDEGAGELACQHLLEQGCKHILHITGPERYMAVRQRIKGYQQVLKKQNLTCLPVEYGSWSSEHGYSAMKDVLTRGYNVDGVITGNDLIGHGVLLALSENNKLVPKDVAVVSFDNWQVITDLCRPGLSSIDFQLKELGRIAGENLIDKIDGQVRRGKVIVPCFLQTGESSCRHSQN